MVALKTNQFFSVRQALGVQHRRLLSNNIKYSSISNNELYEVMAEFAILTKLDLGLADPNVIPCSQKNLFLYQSFMKLAQTRE